MPLSLHTATRRQGINSGMAQRTIRDASRRATKAFLPATSLCDMLFSGVFERYPDLKVGVVEFELSWVPYLLNTMDYTYRERHEEATYRFKDGLLPSDLFHRLSFQEDAVGIRLRDIIGVDNIMGLGLSAQRVNLPQIPASAGRDSRSGAAGGTGQDRRTQCCPALSLRRRAPRRHVLLIRLVKAAHVPATLRRLHHS